MIHSISSLIIEHWGAILGAACGISTRHWYRHARNPWCVVSAGRVIKTYGSKDDAIKHVGKLKHNVVTSYAVRLRDLPESERIYV